MRHSLPAEVMLPLLALLAKLCSVPSGNLPKANVLAVLVFLAFADSNAALSTGTGLVYELYPRLPVDGVSEFHVQVGPKFGNSTCLLPQYGSFPYW